MLTTPALAVVNSSSSSLDSGFSTSADNISIAVIVSVLMSYICTFAGLLVESCPKREQSKAPIAKLQAFYLLAAVACMTALVAWLRFRKCYFQAGEDNL